MTGSKRIFDIANQTIITKIENLLVYTPRQYERFTIL